eukprot:3891992-Amphidinium_carterae.2
MLDAFPKSPIIGKVSASCRAAWEQQVTSILPSTLGRGQQAHLPPNVSAIGSSKRGQVRAERGAVDKLRRASNETKSERRTNQRTLLGRQRSFQSNASGPCRLLHGRGEPAWLANGIADLMSCYVHGTPAQGSTKAPFCTSISKGAIV